MIRVHFYRIALTSNGVFTGGRSIGRDETRNEKKRGPEQFSNLDYIQGRVKTDIVKKKYS